MGWGHGMRGTTITTTTTTTTTTLITTTTFSSPPGVINFGFSTFALCLLRDVEKETRKHEVLWERYFCVPQTGFGRGATENDYIFFVQQRTITFSFIEFCKF